MQASAGTVTLQFSLSGTGQASGFSNSAAVTGVDGLRWGVIVDTAGNGLLPGQYDGDFDIDTPGFLTINGGVPTDDYYVAHPAQAVTLTSGATAGDPGGAGTITAIAGVPYGGDSNVTEGDAFMLVWFENGTAASQKYGTLQNDSGTGKFLIPAEAAVQSYAAFFAGAVADPIRGTAHTFSQQNPPGILAIDAAAGTIISVNEEAGQVLIPVRRTLGSGSTVGFTATTTNGSATAGSDFTAPAPPTFSIAAGTDSVNVVIPILNPPNTSEANETFTVSIGSPTGGAALGQVTSVTVRIIDSIDSTAPSAPTIASPAAGSLMGVATGGTLPITGNATDNKGVARVKVKLNGGEFVDAVLTTPNAASSGWNLAVLPVTGANTITVQSVDTRGNSSTQVVRSFTVTRPLEVSLDTTLGTVTAGFLGTTYREVGKSYSITATPKAPSGAFAGGMFVGWSLSGEDVAEGGVDFTPERLGLSESALEKAALTFVFREGLKLTANFIENPYDAGVIGTYNGLIKASGATAVGQASEGAFSATVQSTGAFSSKITLDGQVLNVAGSFDAQGRARFGVARALTQVITRTGKPSLTVQFDIGGPDGSAAPEGKILGDLSATDLESEVAADRAHFTGLTAALTVPDAYLTVTGSTPAPAGRADGVFTVALPSVALAAQPPRIAEVLTEQDYPKGDGLGTIRVTKAGAVTLAGTLADGTVVTATSTLSQDLRAALFVSLYSAKGFLSAPLQLDAAQADSDLKSAAGLAVLWSRPYIGTSHYYPHGWPETLEVGLVGARYVVTAGQSVLKAANGAPLQAPDADGNTALELSNGQLAPALVKSANLSTGDVVTKVPANDASFTMSVNRTSGVVSGTFRHTDNTTCNYSGVILQKGPEAGARGFFLTKQPTPINFTGESGSVKVIGAP
jgi:hypothetical protein